jgi:adenylosuccinate synthase
MIADVVVGLQYGDEGKGKVTHHLCKTGGRERSLIIFVRQEDTLTSYASMVVVMQVIQFIMKVKSLLPIIFQQVFSLESRVLSEMDVF